MQAGIYRQKDAAVSRVFGLGHCPPDEKEAGQIG